MTDARGKYHVKIEPSAIGGYMVILSKRGTSYRNTKHVDTVEEGKVWARECVAWLRDKAPAVEFEL